VLKDKRTVIYCKQKLTAFESFILKFLEETTSNSFTSDGQRMLT
jgi:hypothetical protein